MDSAFDVNQQLESSDHKIVVALERIAEAFRVLLWQETKKTGLSPIQLQLLIKFIAVLRLILILNQLNLQKNASQGE